MVRRVLAAFVLMLGLCLAHAASAQSKEWDQATVTGIAGELEDAISGLRDIVRTSPNVSAPAMRRQMYEILDILRQMEFLSGTLHAELKKGSGMEETLPTYNRLQQERRDAEVKSRRVDISAITQPKLDKARELLAKIEPYYPPQPQIQDLK